VKIMIVDDEPDMVSVVVAMLKRGGFGVMQAYSGQECLDKVAGDKPDLILMDVMMPGINGFETTKKIKENPQTKDIPVVMLTAKTSKDAKLEGFQNSLCDGYVEKPVKMEDLLKVVNWILE
jgi:CheY-like chemotaxis protein